MAKLRTTVHVDGQAYGPGDDVPDDIAARISNPNVWDGDAPEGAGSAVEELPLSPVLTGAATSPVEALAQVTAERDRALAELEELRASASGTGDGPPPKGGAGSGKDAWAAYAASNDVEVDEDATRDEIITALEAADVPTE